MKATKMTKTISNSRLLLAALAALPLTAPAFAAAPGIIGPTFSLTAQDAYLNQPDGQAVYSWGYGCQGAPTGFLPAGPAAMKGATCPTMQVPGPTLIVTEGQTVIITLSNHLPTAAGNTSILFPGFTLTSSCGTPAVQGLLTCEAPPGGSVTYSFMASAPGTHPYYSGTQGDLQVEMGLYGALIVLPNPAPFPPPAAPAQPHHLVLICMTRTWRSKQHMEKPISGSPGPRTTTPGAATTVSTCSSGPRWIRGFTSRRWRK